MRLANAALISTLAVATPALPAEQVTIERGKVIERAIMDFLPRGVAGTGLVRIAPGKGAYDLVIDIARLFEPADDVWRLSESTPIIRTLTPLADGNWLYEGAGPFRFKADSLQANRPNSVSLEAADFSTKMMVDSVLGFARSVDIGLRSPRIAFRSGQDSLKFSADSYGAKLSVEDEKPGRGTLVNRFTLDAFGENFGSFPNAEVSFRAASIAGTQKVVDLDFAALRLLGTFHREQLAKGANTLSDADAAKLREVLKQHVPLATALGEETLLSDVVVESAGKAISAGKIGYQWGLSDIGGDGAFLFSSQFSDIAARGGTLPKGADGLLPKALSFKLGYAGFKLGALMNEWAEDPRGDRLRQDPDRYDELLAPGPLTLSLEQFSVSSVVYDISAQGSLTFLMSNTRAPRGAITVTAKDFDRTVKFLQEGANTVPQLGQLAFSALMAKGFGEALPDGAMRWKIEIDAARRTLTINGQRIGG